MKYYIIRNKDNHEEYWTNDDGWVEYSSNADEWSEDEKMLYSLPADGEWVMSAEDDKEPKNKWFNLVGNPIDGFRLLGPFASHEDAVEWQEGCDESCWTIEAESEGLY